MNYKIFPWIPVLGLLLVPVCFKKDCGLDNPTVFVLSLMWQIVWTFPIMILLIELTQ